MGSSDHSYAQLTGPGRHTCSQHPGTRQGGCASGRSSIELLGLLLGLQLQLLLMELELLLVVLQESLRLGGVPAGSHTCSHVCESDSRGRTSLGLLLSQKLHK